MYKITWEIDIEADSPLAAAQIARGIQLDPESTATVFIVDNGETAVSVDLMEYDHE